MGYGHRHGGHHHGGHDHGGHHHGHDCCERGHHGGHDHDRGGHDGPDFDEKRVIDTIVDLVEERVQRLLDAYQDRGHQERGGDHDEKRVIDLVVRLISEHVREIVAEELDRRMGRPDAPAAPPAPRGDEPR